MSRAELSTAGMTLTVQRLADLPATAWAAAGGKGGMLARLSQAGYPIPDGLIMLPDAFVGDRIRSESWDAVRAILGRMRPGSREGRFAVRSSALGEDSDLVSFAGAFETILDVQTDDQVREAILAVRQSRHGPRALDYSRARGVDAPREMAVVIQLLVAADISGVLFTADPVSGSCAAMTGNFVHGLGERLVSGEAEPHTFSLGQPRGSYTGPPALRRYARPLYRLANRLEKDLGGPQDMEWAVAGGRLYLLQSRPITTLQVYNSATGEWNDSLLGNFLWSNANLSEAVPDVMTPATWSLVRILHVYTSSSVLPAGTRVSGNICGRPYVNVSVALSLYRLMGLGSEAARRRVEELFGRLPEGVEPEAPRLYTIWDFVRLVPANIRLEIAFRQRISGMRAFAEEAPVRCHELKVEISQTSCRAELAALWRERIYSYVFSAFSMLRGSMKWFDEPAGRLRHELVELVGPADAHALLSGISSAQGFLDSLGPVLGVARVARGDLSREEYLALYGHRSPHEWEVSIAQPAEDPNWLGQRLDEFRAAPVNVETLLERQRGDHEAAWDRFQKRYPKKTEAMRRRVVRFAEGARLRETVRSEVTRVPGIVRAYALRVGALTGIGDDVFFLTLNEMLDLLDGDRRVVETIPNRRNAYMRYCSLPPYPSFINGPFDPFTWAADPNRRSDLYDAHKPAPLPDADMLQGFPGAAGKVEGRVRVLHGFHESGELQRGEILVAATTNVGWTPLFPRAAAIITDVGAPLSHAAIVARELGVPAVVGCGDATARLRTGDRVLVDGGQGVVHILRPGT